ncbi:YebC/PmpR family DNA-binding transcriptional regulator [Buchnera aphidicola]|uniref:YebC/PmpR family DNA-binding transcriptional regulator n=1 Tax=Buchnera aphidicola TaxID=9 RepID=UPI003464E127
MAGHSKWANTKHRKAAQDFKKSKIFTKIIKELIVASKSGGENPDTNPNLRTIIEKALNYNMSRNTIKKTISKNISIAKNSDFKKTQYGIFGKKGIAIMLDCLSNNKNRTVSDIRYICSKFNFNLVPIASVNHIFKKQRAIFYLKKLDILKIKNISIQYGAEYIFNHNTQYVKVISDINSLNIVKKKLSSINIKPSYTELFVSPYVFLSLNKEENIIFSKFIKKLKNNADIKNIYHNLKIINTE